MADYVGINGSYFRGGTTSVVATPHHVAASSYGNTVYNGVIVKSGGHAEARSTNIKDITDGTSNTMMVSEQSNYFYDETGTRHDLRGNNWSGGAWAAGRPENDQWTLNVTSIRFPINFNNTARVNGMMHPYHKHTLLNSAHTGGVHGLLADGSVRFISENLNFATLTALGDRADNATIGEF